MIILATIVFVVLYFICGLGLRACLSEAKHPNADSTFLLLVWPMVLFLFGAFGSWKRP